MTNLEGSAASTRAAPSPTQLAHFIADIIFEKKGEECVVLDTSRTVGPLADYLIVATARGKRQVQALSEEIMDRAKAFGARRLSETGRAYGFWVLLDYGDVIVHLMQPEARRFYDIDALYSDAQVVRRSVDDVRPDTEAV